MIRVLLTRPHAQAQPFAAALEARFEDALECVIAPLVEIVLRPINVDFRAFDALVFTSQNGVAAYQASDGPAGTRAYCVGGSTAEAALEAGLDAISADGDIHALNALVKRSAGDAPLLHISGQKVAGEVSGNITRVVGYDQKPVNPGEPWQRVLAHSAPVIVPLFSPFVASRFQQLLGSHVKARLVAICMSPTVALNVEPRRLAGIQICKNPTAQDMMSEIGVAIESLSA